MAHPVPRFLALSAALGTFAGCAAVPATGGIGTEASPGQPAAASLEAGWLLFGRTEGASVYIDPRSTLRVGSSAFIMVVAAKHQPMPLTDGASVGSLRERYEIDCAGLRYRRHDGTVHPDRAALGPVLGQVGHDQWKKISPDTVMAAVSSAACSGATAPNGALPGAPPGPGVRPPGGPKPTFRT